MLQLSRQQILAHRRKVSTLDERLPRSSQSLERAAAAGFQDSMPRAALLSIHARVDGTTPETWREPPLIQVWGPRYSAYVIAESDLAVFTLGRLPTDAKGLERANSIADRLEEALGGKKMDCREVTRVLGVDDNTARYAAPTGRLLIHWDGARQPLIWSVPAPEVDPFEAMLELARRFLHVLGPGTPDSFGSWAGRRPAPAHAAFEALEGELLAVGTPLGEAFILASDEEDFRSADGGSATRLLPSGDPYYLLWGDDRELLVPDPDYRSLLWTSRVWPGAVLVDGEIVGTWRRSKHEVTVEPWQTPAPKVREAIEAEAATMPLPGLTRPIAVAWA